MPLKFNMEYLFKGLFYASLLLIAPILGAILRASNVNFYVIWGVVAIVNAIAVIYVFHEIKKILLKHTEEKKSPYLDKSDEKVGGDLKEKSII